MRILGAIAAGAAALLLVGCASGAPSAKESSTAEHGLKLSGTIRAYNSTVLTSALTVKDGDSCSPNAPELQDAVLVKNGAGEILQKGSIEEIGKVSLQPQGSEKVTTWVFCTVDFTVKDVSTDERVYIVTIGGSDSDVLSKAEIQQPLSFNFGSALS